MWILYLLIMMCFIFLIAWLAKHKEDEWWCVPTVTCSIIMCGILLVTSILDLYTPSYTPTQRKIIKEELSRSYYGK